MGRRRNCLVKTFAVVNNILADKYDDNTYIKGGFSLVINLTFVSSELAYNMPLNADKYYVLLSNHRSMDHNQEAGSLIAKKPERIPTVLWKQLMTNTKILAG